MYAIVEIAGQQFRVAKDQKVFVHRLEANEGDKVSFDEVLLLDNEGKVTVGTPLISGAGVKAEVLKHLKGDKVIVFKKKRRKGYQKANGHRQQFTELLIKEVLASGHKATKKVAEKKEEPKKEVKKVEKKTAKVKKADDLKKIEGIGPKIAEILTEAGYPTFADVAKLEADKIREILLAKGNRYASHNPNTWPKQAELAAAGKWDELKAWQDELDGGKE